MASQSRHGAMSCHQDARASLSITPGRTAVLFHCFAGCTLDATMAALRDMRLNPTIDAACTAAAS
jgi:putative DNA primase/helicase